MSNSEKTQNEILEVDLDYKIDSRAISFSNSKCLNH